MKGLLSKVEYIVIGVLALIFLMWTVSKCNAHKEEAQGQAAIESQEDSLAQAENKELPPPIAQQPAVAQQPASSPDTYQPIDGSAPATTTTTTATQPAAGSAASAKPAQTQADQPTTGADAGRSKLFVTIDKLKVRKTPGLKGELLGELKLFDEVYYMDEVTDSSFTVNLGTEKATEPYVKIKTKRGTVGWVFGAGVHYVKKKRSGVLQ
jgi:hypothetical protein